MNDEELRERILSEIGSTIGYDNNICFNSLADNILSLIKSYSSTTLTTSRIEWLKKILPEESESYQITPYCHVWNACLDQILKNAEKEGL